MGCSTPVTTFIRQDTQHPTPCLERFIQGSQTFRIQHPQRVVVRSKAVRVPKKDKWAHILPGMLQTIAQKAAQSWDVDQEKRGVGI